MQSNYYFTNPRRSTTVNLNRDRATRSLPEAEDVINLDQP
jgi:hypothetical protein